MKRLVPVFCCLLLGAGCAKKTGPAVETAAPSPSSFQVIEHEIAAGESLSIIADNYYGDPDRAAAIARDNGLADPDQVVPGSVLALRFANDEWDAARRRSSALVPYNRGVDLMAREKLAEAERQFRLALDTAPDLTSARYNLALVQLQRGHSDEALVQLEELTTTRPANLDFRFARGNALFQLTRFEEAVVQFREVLAVDPTHKRAAFGLARSLQEAGHKSQAMAAWNAYLELDGSSNWARVARRNLQQLSDPGGE